jgi:ribonuclease HI
MKKIHIYTDGGCRGNGRTTNKGAFAFAILNEDGNYILHSDAQVFENTTNNQMELGGVIAALRYCAGNGHVEDEIRVYTDSQYVYNGITDWIHTWMAKNWRTSTRKEVLNKELWQSLWELTESLNVNFIWVRGHNNDQYNEYVDALCNEAMDKVA